MEFRILGPLELHAEAGPLTLGGRRQRALLTLLLLDANQLVSTERIIDALWGADPPPTAGTAIHVTVSRLRKLLREDPRGILVTKPGGYLLRLKPAQLDAACFEQLVRSGRGALAEGRPEVAAERLREALGLWRGPALADLRYEAFAQNEIGRLEELRVAAIEDRIAADLALGRHAELVSELESLIRAHPLRERLRAQLMLALYRCGRQADALEAYRDARRALVDELGIEPSADLRELQRAILNQDPALKSSPRGGPRKGKLPAAPTSLVGRQHELRAVVELLRRRDVRLVTLTGAPGTGKTRLALEAATVLADEFDRVAFVALAPIVDPHLVVYEIARALGVAEAGGSSILEVLEADLRDSSILLVLDNLEHVLPAADDLAELLALAPRLNVLATSREPLRLSGEHEQLVPPLALPDLARVTDPASLAGYDAVALFVQRAQAVKPEFELTEENARAAAFVCVRLDGLPLAIELAAARVRTLTPQALHPRLERPLSVLTRGARDLPSRQKTLRAAIEWSYQLLDAAEATVFSRLSVFAGGCTAASAAAVCDPHGSLETDVVDALASLVEKSLLRWVEGDGEPRFTMLETIRQYAAERLEERHDTDQLRSAHAEHVLQLAEAAYRGRLEDERGWAARLESEHDNLRSALGWLSRHEPTKHLRLAGAIAWFWAAHSHLDEGRERLAEALQAGAEHGADLARALVGAGQLELWQGEAAPAIAHLEQARAIWAELGETLEGAVALDALAYAHFVAGDLRAARRSAEESFARARELGRPDIVNGARIMLCLALVAQGDLAGAEPLAGEAVVTALAEGDMRKEQHARHLLADCALLREDFELAHRRYGEAVRVACALGDRAQAAVDLQGVAMAAAGRGQAEQALRLGGAAAAVLQSLGAKVDQLSFWGPLLDRHLNRTKSQLGARGEAAWTEGAHLGLERAIERALEPRQETAAAEDR
ncbi:MAG: winged helix-turn-helix domain-containing protein [Actinomycetota bacterium]|nr:winged helix-turn-helix domain-containing protein [Actinomycetota bacterium]